MNKKILAFVYNGEKFLLLRNNSKDPSHGGDYWFTVTGSAEADESTEKAVKREIKEESNLNVYEIFDLKWGSIYSWGKEDHLEKNFLAFVKKEKVILNEEHVDFEWLNLNDFIRKINWGLNKEELRKVLQKAIKRELFFKKEKIDDFRKKLAK
jgi:NADH pyrophosphatase NudC (nudix superfamily)